ncbi:disulfide bond formation protein B [Aestuariibius sp. 2305UL40-4]|uniref:disulfide bond formation protein B n=1 Tax=Aestuariibius violaceus TaxID=3234132 RepID=UPI00345F02F6
MTAKHLILIAAGGSAALLLGAWAFQLAGYAPCQMCLWQRWPHGAAIVIGILAYAQPMLAWAGGAAAATSGGIGVYHTGVERGWWDGPASCSGGGDLLSGDLLSTEIAPVVMCDEVVWQFAGLSMASWNAILSLGLAGLWVIAARRT